MDDMISRATAIAQIDKCVALSGIGLEPVMAVRDIKALISVLPAVDAMPVVHGRWIDCKDDHQCSVCKEHTIYDTYVWKAIQFEFCPWCGARMEKDNE